MFCFIAGQEQFVRYPDTGLTGLDGSAQRASNANTLALCKQACLDKNKCLAVVFNDAEEECYMHVGRPWRILNKQYSHADKTLYIHR